MRRNGGEISKLFFALADRLVSLIPAKENGYDTELEETDDSERKINEQEEGRTSKNKAESFAEETLFISHRESEIDEEWQDRDDPCEECNNGVAEGVPEEEEGDEEYPGRVKQDVKNLGQNEGFPQKRA